MAEFSKVIISSEEQAFDLLDKLLNKYEFDPGTQVEFSNWPVLKIHITGRDFNGSVPTRIMPAILELQREVYRVYCELKYGTSNTKKLTQDERDQLELVVKVDKGSSWYETALEKVFDTMFREALARMTPEQITTVLITIAVSITGHFAWKRWLESREKLHQLDITVLLSKEEKEKMEIVQRAATQNPMLVGAKNSIDNLRLEMLSKLKPSDSFSLDGNIHDYEKPFSISGDIAESVTSTPREQSIEKRIDGVFLIHSVDSGSIRGGYRLKVESKTDKKLFTVNLPEGLLVQDQLDALKESEWGKRSIYMEINAKELRGVITVATVVSVSELKS